MSERQLPTALPAPKKSHDYPPLVRSGNHEETSNFVVHLRRVDQLRMNLFPRMGGFLALAPLFGHEYSYQESRRRSLA